MNEFSDEQNNMSSYNLSIDSTACLIDKTSSESTVSPSLLVTTYNWPSALQLCISSVWTQTVLPREIIIADDGSKDETRLVIEKLQSQSPVPIIHVWQPDEGFQAAKIRNRGIAAASGEYVICVDGDVVLDSHFIEDHIHYAEKGKCVCGKRAKLIPSATERFLKTQHFVKPWFLSSLIRFGYNFYAIRSRWLCDRTIYEIADFQLRPRIMSCNIAFWKSDAIRVNGFDEAYTTWGLEDRDFALRLRHAGVPLKCIRFVANQYHLYHPSESKKAPVNSAQYQSCADERRIRAQRGIDQYL